MTELKRRQFLQTVGGAFIATAATGCGPEGRPAAASPQVPTLPVVPDASTRFMEMMGLKYPILQGPAGGVDLAVAVSEAGGLGGLWADSKADVVGLRARTKRALWINFAIVKEQERALKPLPAVLEGVAEAGGPVVIHFSWGLPRKENVAAIRAAKARFAVTVASREGARAAVDVGADYLHCQGLEAGGHLQANRPLDEALRQVVEEAKQVPVIAAGGIGDGLGIRRALLAGAAGAQLGTRFLATRECEYRQEYKDMLLKAKSSDTVATVCFSGNDDDTWGCPHRVLRNATYRRWEAAGSPDRGSRPGEGETIGKANGNDVKRYDYSLMLLRPGSTAPLDDLVLYAGHSVDQTNDIVSAADLLERLWLECMGKVPVAPSRPKPGMYATRV